MSQKSGKPMIALRWSPLFPAVGRQEVTYERKIVLKPRSHRLVALQASGSFTQKTRRPR